MNLEVKPVSLTLSVGVLPQRLELSQCENKLIVLTKTVLDPDVRKRSRGWGEQ